MDFLFESCEHAPSFANERVVFPPGGNKNYAMKTGGARSSGNAAASGRAAGSANGAKETVAIA